MFWQCSCCDITSPPYSTCTPQTPINCMIDKCSHCPCCEFYTNLSLWWCDRRKELEMLQYQNQSPPQQTFLILHLCRETEADDASQHTRCCFQEGMKVRAMPWDKCYKCRWRFGLMLHVASVILFLVDWRESRYFVTDFIILIWALCCKKNIACAVSVYNVTCDKFGNALRRRSIYRGMHPIPDLISYEAILTDKKIVTHQICCLLWWSESVACSNVISICVPLI